MRLRDKDKLKGKEIPLNLFSVCQDLTDLMFDV